MTGLRHGEREERLGQLLETLVVGQGFWDGGHFVGGHIAGVVLARLPALQLEEGRGTRAAGLATALAPLHAGKGVHLLKDLLAMLVGGHGEYPAD